MRSVSESEAVEKSASYLDSKKKKEITLQKWNNLVHQTKNMDDPWKKYSIEQLPEDSGTRYRFNIDTNQWVEDIVSFKMQNKSFARGSMRECFRMKKLSNFTHNNDWAKATNVVAKKYLNAVPTGMYFDDVQMQMMGKREAIKYNQLNPPKKIDMIQMSVLKRMEDGKYIYYHLENFIEGTYIKYNSNSGFVENKLFRYTPQTFSHFSFENSNGYSMVVDVQGVNDLYTDPQIHSLDELFTSDGNLGNKGFTLFFASHICNPVCELLGLTTFHLSPTESNYYMSLYEILPKSETSFESDRLFYPHDNTEDEDLLNLEHFNTPKIYNENLDTCMGQIHWQLAKYHFIDYFKIKEIDRIKACEYHIMKAVRLYHKEALSVLTKWLFDISCGNELSIIDLSSENFARMKEETSETAKLKWLLLSYEQECEGSSLYLAKYYDKLYEKTQETQDINLALKYYEEFVSKEDSLVNELLDDPLHKLMCRMGELYQMCEKYDMAREMYESAASSAMDLMQGKQAMRYYELMESLP